MINVKELISEAIKERNDLVAGGIGSFSPERIAGFDSRREGLLCAAEAGIRAALLNQLRRWAARPLTRLLESLCAQNNISRLVAA